MTTEQLAVKDLSEVRLADLRQRGRESAFWEIQVGVLAVTIVHWLVELSLEPSPIVHAVSHLPVLFYLVPVAFGGLLYGVEGGLLTGLEAAALTVPNVLFMHTAGYEWVGELASVAIVIAFATVLAIPVEQERRQRERAESRGRRLAFLNALTTRLAREPDPADSLDDIVERLVDVASLESASICVEETGGTSPRVITRRRAPSGDPDDGVRDGAGDAGSRAFPLRAESLRGELVVVPRRGAELGAEEEELLAAVAHHLSVELETGRIRREERDGLRAYVHAVTRGQEEERTRIARELHDDAAQPLVQLIRSLGNLAEHVRTPDETRERAEKLRGLAVSILETIRDFSRHLRPTALDDLGLVPALEHTAREAAARAGIDVEFRVTGRKRRLSPDVDIVAYRVAQEAIRNVERHASAGRLEVRVAFAPGCFRVAVEDDGCGFSVADGIDRLAIGGRLGLVGMQERVHLLGGTFELRTAPGTGTTLAVELPG